MGFCRTGRNTMQTSLMAFSARMFMDNFSSYPDCLLYIYMWLRWTPQTIPEALSGKRLRMAPLLVTLIVSSYQVSSHRT